MRAPARLAVPRATLLGEPPLKPTAPGDAPPERVVTGTGPFNVFLGNAEGVQLEANGQGLEVPEGWIYGDIVRFTLAPDGALARWILRE